MGKSSSLVGVLGLFLGLTAEGAARADLPPPPGQTRVDYKVRVAGTTQGVVLIAFPTYVSGGGSVAKVTPDEDLRFFQGYRPGIYSLTAEDAASLAGKDGDAIDKVLAAKAHVCVKQVPRVFTVPTLTKVTSMIDVFQIEATPGGCHASLIKTLYGGANGEQGEGTVDSAGNRLPPAPFGKDLPRVEDSSVWSAGEKVAPARGGCAGCALPAGSPVGGGALVILALAAGLARWAARPRGC